MTKLLLTLALLQGADRALTYTGLQQGARECNPLLPQRPAANLLVGTATSTLALVLLVKLAHTKRRTAAWLAVGEIGVEGTMVTWNSTQLRSLR